MNDLNVFFVEKAAACGLSLVNQALMLLMLENGLRISEISSGCKLQVLNNGQVSVYQSKTKSWRLAFLSNELLFNVLKKNGGVQQYELLNYKYWYRLFKKLGISHLVAGNVNASVTHAPRHLYASSLSGLTADDELVTRGLGHKSASAKKSYVGRKSNSNVSRRTLGYMPDTETVPFVTTKKGIIRSRAR